MAFTNLSTSRPSKAYPLGRNTGYRPRPQKPLGSDGWDADEVGISSHGKAGSCLMKQELCCRCRLVTFTGNRTLANFSSRRSSPSLGVLGPVPTELTCSFGTRCGTTATMGMLGLVLPSRLQLLSSHAVLYNVQHRCLRPARWWCR